MQVAGERRPQSYPLFGNEAFRATLPYGCPLVLSGIVDKRPANEAREGGDVTDDTITLALSGDLTLDDFASAVSRFRSVVAALSKRSGGEKVEWALVDLERNGAILTHRGRGSPPVVERVVRAYEELGSALERQDDLAGYPKSIRKPAHRLVEILNGHVESMRFETARTDATIRRRDQGVTRLPGDVSASRGGYGVVQGRVQTLSSRGSLHFILYDTVNDRAVSCYLSPDEDNEAIMKNVWGKLASVRGWVKRDPEHGRPTTIRDITAVTILPDDDIRGYRRARATMPWMSQGENPEDVVRRIRDA